MPACRDHPHARTAGVRKAPRHEIAGWVRYANQLPLQIEGLIVRLKAEKPHWGARKIRELRVRRLDGDIRVPAKSTIHAVLDRHGLVRRGGGPRTARAARRSHVCSRGSSRRRGPASSATLAGCGRAPESGSFRRLPTVGAAVEALARYIHVHNESVRLRIERHGDLIIIAPMLLLGRPVAVRQGAELLLGITYRILSAFLGAGWRPLDVHRVARSH